MNIPIRIILASMIFLVSALPSSAEDLFDQNRPDTAIKMIHFPKSLAVIEHTPMPMEGASEPRVDWKTITRILKKLDPARMAPSKGIIRTDQKIDRDTLNQLGKETESDILLVYRREVLNANDKEVNLRVRSFVYFVKQKKVLPLPDQTVHTRVDKYNATLESAFKKLAQSARKTILSWKFEKRQSAY